MREVNSGYLYSMLVRKKGISPLQGQLELTYRCELNCVHCYCKGSEDKERELETSQWKDILDIIKDEGCMYIVFTGGNPFIRDDFLDIFLYAKKKGFIITIFTNGYNLTDKVLRYFSKYPPHCIEITLNGITQGTYETITRKEGSFKKVITNIQEIKKINIPLILKANCLKQNKDELVKIKIFADEFLGKRNGKYHFRYDPMIYPRLNGNKIPCDYRLSFEELLELRKQDEDIWSEYKKSLESDLPDFKRDRIYLYRCNAWMNQFFINPYGKLKFCVFSDKFSIDLKDTSFREGFYKVFPQLLEEKFKTDSKCIDCRLRSICYHCPARAYLETGDEEAPVSYYCELAEKTAKLMGK
ncbi:MAG: radical SAM protein [Candidatus Omnitrophica bacterium]|nr:radical SAM protein [Candidatus Omnitrophota bacterium]